LSIPETNNVPPAAQLAPGGSGTVDTMALVPVAPGCPLQRYADPATSLLSSMALPFVS
jgi:hypothetical protein